VPTTIVIGPAEHLPALQARGVVGQTSAFDDTDALGALDAITDQRPDVVLIEHGFAETPRGLALIKRLKADPTLAACNIRVVAPDGRDAPLADRERASRGVPTSPAAAAVAAAPAAAPATTPATAPATTPQALATLDQRGTRRAPRAVMPEGLDVQIDGNPATLVNLSPLGAQVISPTSLKPSQRIRFTLPDTTQTTRCRATVVWAAFEIPQGLARYRAGIEFVDADQAIVARFIQTHANDTR
jgi:hypothetical protein